MLGKIACGIVSGAVSLLALYVVGRLAYKAGKEMANMENRYKSVARKTIDLEQKSDHIDAANKPKIETETTIPMEDETNVEEDTAEDIITVEDDVTIRKVSKKKGLFGSLKELIGNSKPGVLTELFRNPEGHRMEACVNGGGVDIRISKRKLTSQGQ